MPQRAVRERLWGFVRRGRRDDDDGRGSSRASATAAGGQDAARLPTDGRRRVDDKVAASSDEIIAADETAVAVRPEINNSGGDTPRGEWPLAGTRDAGLLECLLRATCLPSLPEELAELSTTLVLTLLFNPEFKVAFASALVRHYRDLVLFPNTLPWPGVSRMDRGGSAPIASGLSDSPSERIRGEMSEGPISAAVTAMNVDDSDTDSDDDATVTTTNDDDDDDVREQTQAQLAARRRAAARRRGIDGGTTRGPQRRFPSRGGFVLLPERRVRAAAARVRLPVHGSRHRAALRVRAHRLALGAPRGDASRVARRHRRRVDILLAPGSFPTRSPQRRGRSRVRGDQGQAVLAAVQRPAHVFVPAIRGAVLDRRVDGKAWGGGWIERVDWGFLPGPATSGC